MQQQKMDLHFNNVILDNYIFYLHIYTISIFIFDFPYITMIYKSSPVWTIKSKISTHQQPITPSPHAYTPKTNFTLSKSPTWKLGRSQRVTHCSMNQTPCPNQYNPYKPQKSHKNGKFQHAQKLKENVKAVPGPGAYNIPPASNNKASIFNKFCEIKIGNINIPGPGNYQTPMTQLNRKGIKICRSRRFITEQQQKPGPGSYHLFTRPSSSIAFTRAGRLENNNTQHQSTKTPGPGQYSPKNTSFHNSPSATMAGKYIQRGPDRTPSPTDYNPQYEKIQKQKSSYSIGKGERDPLLIKNDSPGPALYNAKDTLETKGSAIFVREIKKALDNLVPGPGTYTPNHQVMKQRPKSAKIGKSLRFINKSQIIPSPLQYNPHRLVKTSHYSFSKGKRMTSRRDSSPGPGSYNISSCISHNASYVWK